MVRFVLDLAGLASAGFACSPLQETVLSLRMWTHPRQYPRQLPWFRRLQDTFTALDAAQTRLLCSLVASNRWLPDFLTPCPASPGPPSATNSPPCGPPRPAASALRVMTHHADLP
ncbi:hypothetical protein [Streptomyces echinatus]|uniref:Uncharacterized protein n=1 Tax=Streptomyces echinatus TaxID=67293 RepID=A0A7W9Q2V2_9ACTN|nr:hypothetical protein [Streptomyces echinatus]MBB5932525.1 hypothetical protein [Streptomyces echinatus]